ncbi:hypothetical protein M9H77_07866 [Catharanthus roseus]|uniref:Uncharacterized protein n=1 Tax=Catharanthus roseus TaxID=4058 RepID=A0ACC0BWG1_CATRO|nr:hypothetical protein M9H77_07866 [Catharanthus roseus]
MRKRILKKKKEERKEKVCPGRVRIKNEVKLEHIEQERMRNEKKYTKSSRRGAQPSHQLDPAMQKQKCLKWSHFKTSFTLVNVDRFCSIKWVILHTIVKEGLRLDQGMLGG